MSSSRSLATWWLHLELRALLCILLLFNASTSQLPPLQFSMLPSRSTDRFLYLRRWAVKHAYSYWLAWNQSKDNFVPLVGSWGAHACCSGPRCICTEACCCLPHLDEEPYTCWTCSIGSSCSYWGKPPGQELHYLSYHQHIELYSTGDSGVSMEENVNNLSNEV